MGKIDLDKFVYSMYMKSMMGSLILKCLEEQGLTIKDGEIKEKAFCFEEDKWYVFTHASLHYDTINGEVTFKKDKPYRCIGGVTFLGDGGDYCFRGQEDMLRNLRPATEEEIKEISGNNEGISPNCELTEFEEAVKDSMFYDVCYVPTNEDVKRQASKLLDLARKEVLKDLPKWKLNLSDVSHLPYDYSIVYEFESGKDYSCATRMLECGNYRISISELLDKLPKEE